MCSLFKNYTILLFNIAGIHVEESEKKYVKVLLCVYFMHDCIYLQYLFVCLGLFFVFKISEHFVLL